MKSILNFLSMITLLLGIACVPKDDAIKKVIYGPLCGLINSTPALILCIEYSKGTPFASVQTNCSSERTLYTSSGASSTRVTDTSTTYCDLGGVGKCTLSDKVITYYSSEFTSGQGESDCTSRSGTYQ